MFAALILCLAIASPSGVEPASERSIRIPLNADRVVSIGDVVRLLAEAAGIEVSAPRGTLSLPVDGVSWSLTRSLLADCLGPDFRFAVEPDSIVLTFPDPLGEPTRLAQLRSRLKALSGRVEQAAREKLSYGMWGLDTYRPNDPGRPTVCLVHGLNSSSGGFVHLIKPLEEAGYGVVVFDYPYNRPLEESCDRFRRDWAAFRGKAGESRSWAILAHSMGGLVARSLIEDGAGATGKPEVASLIMVAPVNQGSHIAKLQTVLQLISGIRAINDKEKTRAFSVLSDGIGQAAQDLLPGSRFLVNLNGKARRQGVAYHILAGDSGFVTKDARRQIETRIDELARISGIFGRLARVAAKDLPELLDEISDGTGDGCVSVEGAKLDGVADPLMIHANHAELIRAPILFPDAGPVACMPYVLEWLRKDLPSGGIPKVSGDRQPPVPDAIRPAKKAGD